MHDAVGLEGRGVPTAVVVTDAFLREARVQQAALGAESLEPVVITHPLSTLTADEDCRPGGRGGRRRQANPDGRRRMNRRARL